MFDVEPETKLNDSQLRRLRMAMNSCHSLDMGSRMIAAVEKFLRVYNLAPGRWESVIKGIKSLNGTSDDAAIFMAGYMARVFIDEIEYQHSGEKLICMKV